MSAGSLTDRKAFANMEKPASRVQADPPMHIYHLTFIFVATLFTFIQTYSINM